jgi:hypothetical protein
MTDHPTPQELQDLIAQGRIACQRALTLDDNPHKWQQGFCEPQP